MAYVHDIAVLPVSGDLNVRTAPALRHTLDRLMRGGIRRLVVNMAEVDYVDSAGLGVLFAAVRGMRERGGLCSLINVKPAAMRALKISRLVDFIPVSAQGAVREVSELDPAVQPLWRTTLPVDESDLSLTRRRVEELARRLPFSADAVFDLTLAVGEAVGNAVDHTCGTGVLATVSAYDDRMVVEVTDCGDGFDPDRAAAVSSAPPDCSCERGRGIRLMRLLADSVSIAVRPGGAGTVVRIVKLV